MSSKAVIALEARKESSEYPFTLDNLDDPSWWLRMPQEVQGMDRTLARRLVENILLTEESDRQFIAQVASLFKGSGLERVGFMYLATAAPDAITVYVASDDSFAIGVDHMSVVLFEQVFSALLHAQRTNQENLSWVMALHDLVVKSFAGQEHPTINRRMLERGSENRDLEPFLNAAREIAERFIIAHELGHVFHNHHKKRTALRLAMAEKGGNGDELTAFDQSAEYEADEWAVQLLMRVAGEEPLKRALTRTVPSIYFGIFALARQLYLPRDVLGKVLADSHPDPWRRAERLKSRSTLDEEGRSGSPPEVALSDLFRRIEAEWANPSFHAAAATLRKRLADSPPSVDELVKRVPLDKRLATLEADYEWAALVRKGLLPVNLAYYAATYAVVASHFEGLEAAIVRWLLPTISLMGLLLALGCLRLAARMTVRRWSAAAYGESIGLLPGGGVSIGLTTFLLKLSAYVFGIASIGVVVLTIIVS